MNEHVKIGIYIFKYLTDFIYIGSYAVILVVMHKTNMLYSLI